jgi:hypothetical protein
VQDGSLGSLRKVLARIEFWPWTSANVGFRIQDKQTLDLMT